MKYVRILHGFLCGTSAPLPNGVMVSDRVLITNFVFKNKTWTAIVDGSGYLGWMYSFVLGESSSFETERTTNRVPVISGIEKRAPVRWS